VIPENLVALHLGRPGSVVVSAACQFARARSSRYRQSLDAALNKVRTITPAMKCVTGLSAIAARNSANMIEKHHAG